MTVSKSQKYKHSDLNGKEIQKECGYMNTYGGVTLLYSKTDTTL